MYRCESWTIKKAEWQRIDDFELWCWRRLLRVPWTARRPASPFWRRSALDIHWKGSSVRCGSNIHWEGSEKTLLWAVVSIKVMAAFMAHHGSQAQQATAVRVVPAWPHSGYLGLETTQPCFLLKLLMKEFSPQLLSVCPALKLLQMGTVPLRKLHRDDRLKPCCL